jgi:hypothetical protein
MTNIINIINTISSKFNNLTILLSKNVSILQQFYINKKINNIYNTNLNDIISNITNNIIEINTLFKTSSFFVYYPLVYVFIDDLRTYVNKVIISMFICILNEKNPNYTNVLTIPNDNRMNVLTNTYYKNENNQYIIDINYNLILIDVFTFEGTQLNMENLYYINFIFKRLTFKVNRVINMFNFIIKTYFSKLP